MNKNVSQTSIETYHNEVKGAKELSQAEMIHKLISVDLNWAMDANSIRNYVPLPLGSIHRSLHNMYKGLHPGLYVDYVIRKNSKNRNTKHWFKVDTCQVKAQTVGDMLVGMGWKEIGVDNWHKNTCSVYLTMDNGWVVYGVRNLIFRGHLTPSNLKVILEAVGAV